MFLAGVAGFEPTHRGIKTRCLTAWLYPIMKNMVSPQGFEPRTHGLEGRCSIQLSYEPTHKFVWSFAKSQISESLSTFGADDENRTHAISLEG